MPIITHDSEIPLEDNAIIWRYMDIEKYESLLRERALFFCRADKFSDPFEGSLPKREADYRIEEAKYHFQRNRKPFDKELAMKNIEATGDLHVKYKRGTVVNCWHINNNESDAMWRLYLKDNEGVAIQSSKERIYNSIKNVKEKIGFSKVRYLDYEKDVFHHPENYPHTNYNLLAPLFHKRIEFTHENEFRLYEQIGDGINNQDYWDKQPNHKGKLIGVDIVSLVERIVLPPTVDERTETLIKEITGQYGFKFEFYKSKLQTTPHY